MRAPAGELTPSPRCDGRGPHPKPLSRCDVRGPLPNPSPVATGEGLLLARNLVGSISVTDDSHRPLVVTAAPLAASTASGHMTGYAAVSWHPGTPSGRPEVEILDQTRLPHEVQAVRTSSSTVVADAIRGMQVRGAPAIGIAAAFGVALAAHEAPSGDGEPSGAFWSYLEAACTALAATRPTAAR